MSTTKRYITYLRVSTDMQSESGLGLEAQRAQIQIFVELQHGEIVAEYVDVESGGVADRVELEKARKHARKAKAVLLVAKWDRLSRDMVDALTMLKSQRIEAVETGPDVDEQLLQMKMLFAQWERKVVSIRTTAALQAKKARGVVLGNPDIAKYQGLGAQATRERWKAKNQHLIYQVAELRAGGLTLAQVAGEMMRRGARTPKGEADWSPTQVRRLLLQKGDY